MLKLTFNTNLLHTCETLHATAAQHTMFPNKFRQLFGRKSSSHNVASISAPYDVRTMREIPDDPNRDSHTKLRHTTGPGLQVMSDLHCERSLTGDRYLLPNFQRSAPYLILAGDIGRLCDYSALLGVLRELCDIYEKVLFVPGNHEFYGTSRDQGLRLANDLSHELGGKFAFMDRTQLEIEDTIVLGCTLHSFIPAGTALTNDFTRIKDWTVADHNASFLQDVRWLEESLQGIASNSSGKRVVVVTHYAPAFLETNHPSNYMSTHRYCFSSDTLDAFKH
jgi:hypothetical protein